MKRLICLILCALFSVSLLPGCGPTEAPETSPSSTAAPAPVSLSVGFGKADITPRAPVPLDGLVSATDRLSSQVRDPLYTICIAFTDGADNTFLLIVSDLLFVYLPLAEARAEISKTTGIPASHIWLATTHNHSGPALNESTAAIEQTATLIRNQVIQAASDALADRKPVSKMYVTDTHPELFNFVRHYIMSDGSYVGDNFGSPSGKEYVKHVSEVDNQLQLVKFTREGGKDVILANWQGHPTGHSQDRYSILSGVTLFEEALEDALDCHAAYVLGASGNVNNSSRILKEQVTGDYARHYQLLAQKAADAAASFREVKIGNLGFANDDCPCQMKAGGTGTMNIPVGAVSMGDVAFVFASYEMFDSNGMYVKENSPFETTFVSSCTNGYNHYIPSEPTFEYGGYEVGKSMVAAGSGEKLAESMVSMLNQLHRGQ